MALLIVFPSPVDAQQSNVQGRVRDEDGSGVFGARVAISSGEGGSFATDTDRLGSYRVSGVPAGRYELTVTALGYATHRQPVEVVATRDQNIEIVVERAALELEGISVEAERSRERTRFEEVPGATVREVNLEEIRFIPSVGEPDPVRAIEVLPGVVSTTDFSASFNVRGGSQDQNLILLDGIPIFSPFHLGGLFSVFNADMIDRVELQSGGFAAEHGGRVSSVLEIESDVGSGELGVDAALSLLSTRAAIGGRLPDGVADALGHANVRYRFSARRSYLDVLLAPVFDFPYHLADFQTVVEGWTRGGDRVTFTAYTGEDVFDLTSFDPDDFPLRVDWDWGNDALGVRWSHPRSGGGSVDLRANFSRFGTGLTFPDFGDTDFNSRIQQGQLRVDLDFRPSGRVSVQTGGSIERMSYRNRFFGGGTEFGGGRGEGTLFGAFVQGRWSTPRSWLVELGVRADGYMPTPGPSIVEASPRFAVKRFLGGGDVAVKLAAGRYTQFVHSLRDEDLPLGLDIWVLAGDRAPHTVSDQVQIGIEGYRDVDWFWSVEAYYRSFDGVVTFNAADNPNDDLDDILGGRGASWGADLMIRRETGDVRGWMALSFLDAERTFPDERSPLVPAPEITFPPIFDRTVDLDLVLSYPAPWGWTGGVRWNLGTGTPFTRPAGLYDVYSPRFVNGGTLDFTGDQAVLLEPRNGARYPVYHRLDVSFRGSFEKSWGTLTPYLSVVNVYNRRNVLFYFFELDEDPPVRSGVSMFPLLPTFGLEVTF